MAAMRRDVTVAMLRGGLWGGGEMMAATSEWRARGDGHGNAGGRWWQCRSGEVVAAMRCARGRG